MAETDKKDVKNFETVTGAGCIGNCGPSSKAKPQIKQPKQECPPTIEPASPTTGTSNS